jgi:hypothetical protein
MPTHKVVSGETLVDIAAKYGFRTVQPLLDAPGNAALVKAHGMARLAAGDAVEIPEKKLKEWSVLAGDKHEFRVKVLKRTVRLVVQDDSLEPDAGAQYALAIGGEILKGSVGSDGLIEAEVPAEVEGGRLSIWANPFDPDDVETFEVVFKPYAPVSTLEDAKARLNGLGYRCGAVDANLDEATKAALLEFQEDAGHPNPSGAFDDFTKNALNELDSAL